MSKELTGALIALTIVLAAMLPIALPAMAEINESVMVTPEGIDEAVNVSVNVSTVMTDETLSFPRENCTLFSERSYLVWENLYPIGDAHRISIGLVPESEEVTPPNAVWVEVSVYAEEYFIWHPPSGMNDEIRYNLIMLVDQESRSMGGIYDQETFYSDLFWLIDPPTISNPEQ